MARVKKTVIVGITREKAEEALGLFAKANAQLAKVNAEIELQCAKLREKQADIIESLSEIREENFAILEAFANENKGEFFTTKKSLEMLHGKIGFRTGTPKLKTLKGFTWASVLQLVREFMPNYIRTSEEVSKEKLLADRYFEGMEEKMAKIGVQVVQDESFFVEPKNEGLEA